MTELRKGQRAQIDVVVEDGERDEDGEVYVRLPTRGEGRLGAYVPVTALRFGPTWHERREAMVREMVASTAWEHTSFAQIVKAADDALRAIDETPVPEGGDSRIRALEAECDQWLMQAAIANRLRLEEQGSETDATQLERDYVTALTNEETALRLYPIEGGEHE